MPVISLKLDDSRRLTGKNYFTDQPGAVLDAFVSGVDKQLVIEIWLEQLADLLGTVNWGDTERFFRIFEDGVSVGFTAPIDALYTATEINEAAWESMVDQIFPGSRQNEASLADQDFAQMLAEEQSPELIALINAAETHGTAYLVDDDAFSLGYGAHAQIWDIADLPAVESVDWQQYQSTPVALPIALVTGTNGKSTTVRLTSQIIKQAGLRCGVTSTDFIRVGDKILDTGDYSGPGGARMLLRHPETEAAVLEVARGGLLRRGLPIPQVDAALVTNVAEDHVGQYGINSVAAMAAAKMMVAKAASKELVLNADDANLVKFVQQSRRQSDPVPFELTIVTNEALASSLVSEVALEPTSSSLPDIITWFSLDENNPVIQNAKADQQNICFTRDGKIIYATAEKETEIIEINAIPMTLDGAAVHNVQNALGAVALSKALGIQDIAILEALANFKSDASDNPGRGNLFEYQGAKIMLDFAHNVHSMDAMASTLRNMPAKRKILLLCHAGDRTDTEIQNMTISAMAMQPDLVWACELPDYLRGREPGEVSKLIATAVSGTGLADSAVHFAGSPLQGVEAIIPQLQTDDLVFVMALSHRDQIATLLVNAT